MNPAHLCLIFSSIEVMLNKYLLFYLLLLIIEVVTATVLKYTVGADNPGSLADQTLPWYLGTDIHASAAQIAQVRTLRCCTIIMTDLRGH